MEQIKSSMPASLDARYMHIDEFNQFEDIYSFDGVAAVGGDGTVNAVASRLQYGNIPLAIIPAGSGDGFARHFKIPKNAKKALKIIEDWNVELVDSGDLSGKFFINVAGTGFEAEVAHEFAHTSGRGLVGYVKVIRETFNKHPERVIEISINEKRIEVSYFSISIANGSQWGNNFKIAGAADLQDSKFEIAVMRKPKWHQIPSLVRTLLAGKQADGGLMSYYTASELYIKNSSDRWHIDGEPLHLEHKNKISCLPNSLSVILPK